ncbi:hypothetical protein [Streptomonospora nanhaiensis]|uniref:hypothetical protein n=1 Tax=Streptomonospora nanhaiensis TaxID=1323731 RepID=UPI001C38EA6A|nr:hypothetical protein [Streptomonospora nanhaiensis]MBV2364235.1 hypothetical protein [Streptomonospora nanhaiensis]
MRAARGRGTGPLSRSLRRARARMRTHPVGRGLLAAGRGLGATARGLGRTVDWASRGRASRVWARARRRPAWARRGWLRRLMEADQAMSAEIAGWLATRLAGLWQATVAWLTGHPRTGSRVRDVRDYLTVSRPQDGAGESDGGPQMAFSPQARRVMAAADELRDALAAYGALGMIDYGQGLDTIPYALEQTAAGVQAMAVDALQTRPLSPAVIEFLLDLSRAIMWLAAKASEVRTVFNQAHEGDILRITGGGRPGEWRWDASVNN